MRPLIRITAEGEDVTARVADRLLELEIADEGGIEADTLSLTLDDRDARLAVPPHGSLVRVSLGMAGPRPVPLTPMGAWRVDATELTGPERQLRINATAADMAGAIRSPRTRAWEDVTLGDIVTTIAREAGLQPVVAPQLATIAPGYVAQTAESDLHLLTRLGRRYGAVAKAADGRLVLARRGAGEAADGTPLPPIAIAAADSSDWRWRSADRGRYASVEASWTALGSGEVNKVVIGEGAPRLVLRHVHATEDEARRAAQARLDEAARGAEALTVRLAGFWPAAFAGARVRFADRRAELGRPWVVVRARHRLGETLASELTMERPANDEESEP